MGRQVTVAGAVAASLVTGVEGDDNAIEWTADTEGDAGNDIAIFLRDPKANNATVSVEVATGSTGKSQIRVNLATNGSGAITTTATEVISAIEGDADAAALVDVANSGDSDGSGVVTATGPSYLTGGTETPTNVIVGGDTLQSGDTTTLTAEEFNALNPTVVGGLLTDGGNVSDPGDAVVTQADNVAAIGDPATATAEDVANAVNAILTASKGDGKPMAADA